MLNLKLDKPLVFFDLETTGVNIQNDRIVEISVIKYFPNGEKQERTRRVNPEMHIPEESSAIHGITDADVENEPTFQAICRNFYIFLEGCDLAGYNLLKFDIPVLQKEFSRCGLTFSTEGRKIVDPYIIFCEKEPRSLEAALKFYRGKELTDAHSAAADVAATVDVLMGQLERYPDLPKDLEGLNNFCDRSDPSWIDSTGKFKWREDEAVVGFGRNAGTPLKDIAADNPGFLRWMINADFADDAKEVASEALKGYFPEKKTDEEA